MTDNDTQAQVDALRAKAEGMGLLWDIFQAACITIWRALGNKGGDFVPGCWHPLAATLLGALDKEAVVVEIKAPDDEGECDYSCSLYAEASGRGICALGFEVDVGICDCKPGPRCLGPAQPGKKWIMVEVPE